MVATGRLVACIKLPVPSIARITASAWTSLLWLGGSVQHTTSPRFTAGLSLLSSTRHALVMPGMAGRHDTTLTKHCRTETWFTLDNSRTRRAGLRKSYRKSTSIFLCVN